MATIQNRIVECRIVIAAKHRYFSLCGVRWLDTAFPGPGLTGPTVAIFPLASSREGQSGLKRPHSINKLDEYGMTLKIGVSGLRCLTQAPLGKVIVGAGET